MSTWRETDKRRKRDKYRNDPAYRLKVLNASKERYEEMKHDPLYGQIIQLRKDLYRLKESYKARIEHAKKLDRRIIQTARELVRLEEKWKSFGRKS